MESPACSDSESVRIPFRLSAQLGLGTSLISHEVADFLGFDVSHGIAWGKFGENVAKNGANPVGK